jgi:flagellar basal body rod protein FlgB
MTGVFDKTFDNLENAMRVASAKQAVTNQNIANSKTPGYEALEFSEELNKAVKRKDNPRVILEEEMDSLSKNSVDYTSYVKLMTQKLNILKTIASQGRK